jgi:hypothetical protein
MNPYLIGGAVLAIALAFAGGTKVGSDFAKGQAAREEVLIEKAGDAAAERAAKAIAGIKVNIAPIRERVETTIRELPPMPVECNTPASINTEVNNARSAS